MSEKFSKDISIESKDSNKSGIYPVMPLRNTVLFPQQVIPIYIGRDRSLKLIEELDPKDKHIVVVAQEDGSVEDHKTVDLYADLFSTYCCLPNFLSMRVWEEMAPKKESYSIEFKSNENDLQLRVRYIKPIVIKFPKIPRINLILFIKYALSEGSSKATPGNEASGPAEPSILVSFPFISRLPFNFNPKTSETICNAPAKGGISTG